MTVSLNPDSPLLIVGEAEHTVPSDILNQSTVFETRPRSLLPEIDALLLVDPSDDDLRAVERLRLNNITHFKHLLTPSVRVAKHPDVKLRGFFKYGDTRLVDPWDVFAETPGFAYLLFGRPLPSATMQCIMFAVALGFRDITVSGYGSSVLLKDREAYDFISDNYLIKLTFFDSSSDLADIEKGKVARPHGVRPAVPEAQFNSMKGRLAYRLDRYARILRRDTYDIGIVVNEEDHGTGGPKPVEYYLRENSGRKKLKRYTLAEINTPLRAWLVKKECKTILLNGLIAFTSENVFMFGHTPSVYVYLHETKYVFDKFKREHPDLWERTIFFLRQVNILCVSQFQKQFLEDAFGIKNSEVIYNCIDPLGGFNYSFPEPPETATVIMVGTLQERKGVELFSRTADLARQRKLPLNFVWIGGNRTNCDLYLSENVTWIRSKTGAILNLLVREADVFFLASSDDPFPLVCLEAIAEGKRIVCYEDTGTAELERILSTLIVYKDYSPEAALSAITLTLERDCVPSEYKYINNTISSIPSMAYRLESALGV